MEDTLGELDKPFTITNPYVLILVLMEDTLGEIFLDWINLKIKS